MFLISVRVSFWLAKMIRIVLRDEVLPNIELPHGARNGVSTLNFGINAWGLLFKSVLRHPEREDP